MSNPHLQNSRPRESVSNGRSVAEDLTIPPAPTTGGASSLSLPEPAVSANMGEKIEACQISRVRSAELSELMKKAAQGDRTALLETCRRCLSSLQETMPFIGNLLEPLTEHLSRAIDSLELAEEQEQAEKARRSELPKPTSEQSQAYIRQSLLSESFWSELVKRPRMTREEGEGLLGERGENRSGSGSEKNSKTEEAIRAARVISADRLDVDQQAELESAYTRGKIHSPDSVDALRVLAEIRERKARTSAG